MTDNELIIEALKARDKAYAPYSSCAVGAALLTSSGKVYYGCNIENASFSPTCCAERTSFFKAVSDGERDFDRIAIVGGASGTLPKEMFPPCGVCRQVMREFCGGDFRIILGTLDENRSYTLTEMLPFGFSENLIK